MRNIAELFLTLLYLSLIINLSAQSEEYSKKSSLEFIAQIYGGSAPVNQDPTSSLFLTTSRTENVFFGQRDNPEIQIRYVKEVAEDISVYGGLSYGINFLSSSFVIRENVTATSSFRSPSEFRTNRHRLSYGSVHIGLRYAVNIKENDAFNFSLGGKGIFFPAKDLSISQSGFSDIRGESFTYNFENAPDDSVAKFVPGLELDVNFQLGFRKSPLKVMLGITLDRATGIARELNSQIVLESLTADFVHNFGGGRAGVYLGLSYAL